MIDRKREVAELMNLSPNEVIEKAGNNLLVCKDLDALHHNFAQSIFDEIRLNNQNTKETKLILPIGPIGQYPILVDLIIEYNLDLSNCWFFFMDEYCDADGYALTLNHPLSFKRIAKKEFLIPLKNRVKNSKIIFPDESNISEIIPLINKIGGIDTCYGGIGIHGHLAFNEPSLNVAKSDPRKVRLNKYTITINAIRAQIGGNLELFPNFAYTIGMNQILNATKIRLYCRNGGPYDWANTILRIALFGEPGDDYPVTYIRSHTNYIIITDEDTLKTPKYVLDDY